MSPVPDVKTTVGVLSNELAPGIWLIVPLPSALIVMLTVPVMLDEPEVLFRITPALVPPLAVKLTMLPKMPPPPTVKSSEKVMLKLLPEEVPKAMPAPGVRSTCVLLT